MNFPIGECPWLAVGNRGKRVSFSTSKQQIIYAFRRGGTLQDDMDGDPFCDIRRMALWFENVKPKGAS